MAIVQQLDPFNKEIKKHYLGGAFQRANKEDLDTVDPDEESVIRVYKWINTQPDGLTGDDKARLEAINVLTLLKFWCEGHYAQNKKVKPISDAECKKTGKILHNADDLIRQRIREAESNRKSMRQLVVSTSGVSYKQANNIQ